ncbi:hypothetical protein QQF64_035692 [Cirrhinus molitorella]|uniref:Uncharacterized protein n=1 Tax=Cirrhinus molitorella TaxID=172907 RepID=A0ABR3NGN3_9TELE
MVAYTKSTVTPIERQFEIPSSTVGIIDGSFEIDCLHTLGGIGPIFVYSLGSLCAGFYVDIGLVNQGSDGQLALDQKCSRRPVNTVEYEATKALEKPVEQETKGPWGSQQIRWLRNTQWSKQTRTGCQTRRTQGIWSWWEPYC